MSDTTSGQTPAGWYADPTTPGQLRWWSGAAWTEHVQPAPTAGAPGASQPQPPLVMPAQPLPAEGRPGFLDSETRPAANGVGRGALVLAIIGAAALALGVYAAVNRVFGPAGPILIVSSALLLLIAVVLGVAGLARRRYPKGAAAFGLVLAIVAAVVAPLAFPAPFRTFVTSFQGFPAGPIVYLATGTLCPPAVADALAAGIQQSTDGSAFTATVGDESDIPAELSETRGDAVCVIRFSGSASVSGAASMSVEGVAILTAHETDAARLGEALTASGYAAQASPGAGESVWLSGSPADILAGKPIKEVMTGSVTALAGTNDVPGYVKGVTVHLTMTIRQ